MSSDGTHLMLMGLNAMAIVEAHTTSHASVKSATVQNPTNVAVGANGFWLTTSDADFEAGHRQQPLMRWKVNHHAMQIH